MDPDSCMTEFVQFIEFIDFDENPFILEKLDYEDPWNQTQVYHLCCHDFDCGVHWNKRGILRRIQREIGREYWKIKTQNDTYDWT